MSENRQVPESRDLDDAARAYLAVSHAPCPGCGFDLHGCERDRCPECGAAIEIGIVRASPADARLMLRLMSGVNLMLALAPALGLFVMFLSMGVPTLGLSDYLRGQAVRTTVLCVAGGLGLMVSFTSTGHTDERRRFRRGAMWQAGVFAVMLLGWPVFDRVFA